MPINIKNLQADELARELAERTGRTITDAVIAALRESLARETGRPKPHSLGDDLREISQRCAALPDLDTRSAEEILGFDERGVPGKWRPANGR
jgi:antitoxin VapB